MNKPKIGIKKADLSSAFFDAYSRTKVNLYFWENLKKSGAEFQKKHE